MYSDIILQTFDAFQADQAQQSTVVKTQTLSKNVSQQQLESRHWLLHSSRLTHALGKQSSNSCRLSQRQGKGHRSKTTAIGLAAWGTLTQTSLSDIRFWMVVKRNSNPSWQSHFFFTSSPIVISETVNCSWSWRSIPEMQPSVILSHDDHFSQLCENDVFRVSKLIKQQPIFQLTLFWHVWIGSRANATNGSYIWGGTVLRAGNLVFAKQELTSVTEHMSSVRMK